MPGEPFRYLRKAIADENEAIKFYGKKPKGVDGKIAGIRKDEMKHKKILQKKLRDQRTA